MQKITEKKLLKNCPKEFTWIDDDEGLEEEYYARCKNNTLQISALSSTKSYGKLPKGEKPEYLLDLTEFDVDSLNNGIQNITENDIGIPLEEFNKLTPLKKSIHLKQYGLGNHIPLGEPIKNPVGKQTKAYAKVFKTKESAKKYMKKL